MSVFLKKGLPKVRPRQLQNRERSDCIVFPRQASLTQHLFQTLHLIPAVAKTSASLELGESFGVKRD